jgi:hypothetical protein
MQDARERGELLKGEAAFQLQQAYLWYEQRPDEALELLEELDARYPHNPIFLERIAGARDAYLHDHEESAAAWQKLVTRAREGDVYEPMRTEVRARIGLARELAALHENDRAMETLQAALRVPAIDRRAREDVDRAIGRLKRATKN